MAMRCEAMRCDAAQCDTSRRTYMFDGHCFARCLVNSLVDDAKTASCKVLKMSAFQYFLSSAHRWLDMREGGMRLTAKFFQHLVMVGDSFVSHLLVTEG